MPSWMMYNPNPISQNVGDCSVRAVSVALNVDWETAFALLTKNAFSMGDMPSSNAVISATLRQHGFYRYVIPNECPNCYSVGDFADDHPNGIYVLGTGSHVVAVKNGVVFDTWDSTKEIPIYYWGKPVKK